MKLTNKQLEILNKYNCNIELLQNQIDRAIPEHKEINYKKISDCIPAITRFSTDGTNPREILIKEILDELEINCKDDEEESNSQSTGQ